MVCHEITGLGSVVLMCALAPLDDFKDMGKVTLGNGKTITIHKQRSCCGCHHFKGIHGNTPSTMNSHHYRIR